MTNHQRTSPRPRSARGFTLTELLVAVGIIAVLTTLTTIGVRGIAKDARISSARNGVVAALDNARGLAMKNNNLTMVVFRPRLEGPNKMIVEAVLLEWSGETYNNPTGGGSPVVDRFVPVQGVINRRLPEGIKVGAPFYGDNQDERWVTQTHLPAINPASPIGPPNEFPGQLVAVTFGPDGTVVTRNSQTDSARFWADFANEDPTAAPILRWRGTDYEPGVDDLSFNPFETYLDSDEGFVNSAPFIVVYDDDDARERRTTDWTNEPNYVAELVGPSGYITQFSDRIHFNRYTGVAME